MNTIKLPFKIGSQYENWEFELDILEDRIKGYDSYLYTGKPKAFLNEIPERIELIFNCDILSAVILTFENRDRNAFGKFHLTIIAKSSIVEETSEIEISLEKNTFVSHYMLTSHISLRLEHFSDKNEIIALYCNQGFQRILLEVF